MSRNASQPRPWQGAACGATALMIVALGVIAPAMAAGAVEHCGHTDAAGHTTRATLTMAPTATTLDLGNDTSGTRQVTLEATTDNACVLPKHIKVTPGIFAGQFRDLVNQGAVTATATQDGNLIHVLVTVHRDAVPAGSYTGAIRLGDGVIGSTTTQLTITRQAPLLWAPLILALIGLIGGIAIAGIRHLFETNPAPTRSAEARAKSSAAFPTAVPSVMWRVLLVAATPFEALARVIVKHIWPILVGCGAAVTAFVAGYVNDTTWHLGTASGIGLISKVGGAALAAAFATWQAVNSANGQQNADDKAAAKNAKAHAKAKAKAAVEAKAAAYANAKAAAKAKADADAKAKADAKLAKAKADADAKAAEEAQRKPVPA